VRRFVARLLRRCSTWTEALSRRLYALSVRLDPGQRVLGGRAVPPARRLPWSPGQPPAHWAALVRRHAPALLFRTPARVGGHVGPSVPSAATPGSDRAPEAGWPAMPATSSPARVGRYEPHPRPAAPPDDAVEPTAGGSPELVQTKSFLMTPQGPTTTTTSAARAVPARLRAADPVTRSRRVWPRRRTTLRVPAAAQPMESTGPEETASPAGVHAVNPESHAAPWPVGTPDTERGEDGLAGSVREPRTEPAEERPGGAAWLRSAVEVRRGFGSGPTVDRWPRTRWRTPASSTPSPYPTLPDDAPLWIDEEVPEDVTDDAEHLDRLDREQRGRAWVDETGRD